MDILADLASPVHLHGLPFQFWQLQLYRRTRIVGWHFELQLEGVPDQVVNKSACAFPLGAFLVRRKLEPVIIFFLVVVDVRNQSLVFFLQPLDPLFAILWTCVHRKHWDLLQNLLHLAFHYLNYIYT